jgi:hypothetical protein
MVKSVRFIALVSCFFRRLFFVSAWSTCLNKIYVCNASEFQIPFYNDIIMSHTTCENEVTLYPPTLTNTKEVQVQLQSMIIQLEQHLNNLHIAITT